MSADYTLSPTPYESQSAFFRLLCEQRVRRGTIFVLDQLIGPTVWPQYINPNLLNLADEYQCMIGQLCVNDMTEQIKAWAKVTGNSVQDLIEGETIYPTHTCNCDYCDFENHSDSEPQEPDEIERGYDLGTKVFAYIAEQRGIILQRYDAFNWEIAHGFMIHANYNSDQDFSELRYTDRWRILTECWSTVLTQRQLDLGINPELEVVS